MPGTTKKLLRAAKEVDGWVELFTGNHIGHHVTKLGKRAYEIFGDDLEKKYAEIENRIKATLNDWPDDNDPDNPYVVLGAHPMESDQLIRKRYRDKCILYHGDTSKHPDATKLDAVVTAYEAIKRARHPEQYKAEE